LFPQNNSYSETLLKNIDDYGIISLMYHRFEENKYPSTNIRIEDFKKQISLIEKENIDFVNPKYFAQNLIEDKNKRKILITIDDAFLSFYENAWPVLKKKKIPFILFVSTREIGAFNYMTWDQIKELHKEDFVEIGNHSHTHEYLVDENEDVIRNDINRSIKIFKENLGTNSYFFSYPFGEYSLKFKKIIKSLDFKYAFGQHSGVMDETKDFFELPRFPINEKYGDLKRFETLIKTLPFKYKYILPNEKYLSTQLNPPDIQVEFFNDLKNLNQLNCYSNELNNWRKSKINFINDKKIQIKLEGKFIGERGRVNCSLREEGGFWRWLGIQFVISEK
jgi:poly-beta-1,6-N-acetyl-D-glucosamine N-deacetylase